MNLPETNVGYLLNKVTQALKTELGNKLRPFDITVPQWSVLRDLYYQEQLANLERKASPAQIAERLHSDRPTISGVIDRLHNKGLIQKKINPTDRRSQVLYLTEAALHLIPTLERASQETIQIALSDIQDSQVSELVTSLQSIIKNLT